jgi:hypothetical protein
MQDLDYYVNLLEDKGASAVRQYSLAKLRDNFEGFQEHLAVSGKGNTSLANRYYNFISQLKQVLNPIKIDKLVKREQSKNLNTAIRSIQDRNKFYKDEN